MISFRCRKHIVAEGKSDAFVHRVIKKALQEEQELTEDKFIRHCNRIADMKVRNNNKKFKVVFPIWGGAGLISGRRKWGDVRIAFDVSSKSPFARRAKLERDEQIQKHNSISSERVKVFDDLPLAVCSVLAIDVNDAFEQAETAISRELGLFSLVSGRGQFLFNNGPDKPINTILLAPHMTVHDPSGAISTSTFWHNRWPSRMVERNRSQEDIEKVQNQVEKVRTRLRKLPWRNSAEKALARQYSAFGQCDLEASFLDGWRLLEAIGGHSREKSETLVKRAAWFFKNRDENYQIGLHLMHRRNLLSHGRPVRDNDNEGLAFQMKEFLRPLLITYLTNPFNFKCVEELWDFCDLPTDKTKRLRQSHILECGSKFRCEE